MGLPKRENDSNGNDPFASAIKPPTTSPLDQVMNRLSQEQKHEDAVNEVMEEIED